MMKTSQQLYREIMRLTGGEFPDHLILKSGGFMDLHIETIRRIETMRRGDGAIDLSLAHYYRQNGDSVPDPDMEVRVYPALGIAEALSYQDSRVYRRVYHEEGRVNVSAKVELNRFLAMWLRNLKAQGFGPERRQEEDLFQTLGQKERA